MSEDKSPKVVPMMREDRPLDALLPGLSGVKMPGVEQGDDAGPAFHPGVLVVEVDGGYEWAFACWRNPGGATELADSLQQMMEAVLLAKMSEPASTSKQDKPFLGLRLFLYDHVDRADEALAEFGFVEVPFVAAEYGDRTAKFSEQAAVSGWDVGDVPESVWHAAIHLPDAELQRRSDAIADAMRDELESVAWGDQPGRHSKTLAEQLHKQYRVGIAPDLESLEHVDLLLVDHAERRVRWLPPMIFQGICDFMAVVAHAATPAQVQWGVSKTDENGWTSPPLIRVNGRNQTAEIPIARRVLQWCIMPQKTGTDDRLRRRFEEAFSMFLE